MKNNNSFTQWKNGSVDVMFTCAITHQKHLAQSGHSTWSAVDIFSTLRMFTNEPIREQEIELECCRNTLWVVASQSEVEIGDTQSVSKMSTAFLALCYMLLNVWVMF